MVNLLLGELERALAHEVLEVGRVALHHEQHVVHDVRAEAALQRPQLHAHQLQVRSLLRVCTPRAALVLYLLMYWPSYLSTRPQTSRCALLFINVRIYFCGIDVSAAVRTLFALLNTQTDAKLYA